MKSKKELDFGVLGCRTLSLAEKVNVLSSRCRAQGVHLHDLIGLSAVTLSKAANLRISTTRKVRDSLLEASHGFIVEEDFAHGPQPTRDAAKAPVPKPAVVKPASKPKAPVPNPEPKAAKAPVVQDDDLDI